MPANTYTLIERITVGAAGASSITFTSIPQTYTDLKVVASARSNLAQAYGDWLSVRFNGSSTSVYTTKRLRTPATGSTVVSDGDTNYSQLVQGQSASANATASTFGNTEFYIPNYTSSDNKSISSDFASETNGTNTLLGIAAGIRANTAAITSIDLLPQDGTSFAQYSTFYLYGIAKEGVSPSPSSAPYATGGDSIVFDGTYWIHTFTSSGTFTPKKSLTCDYLVVAGGGGGGGRGSRGGGGGGAGGLRSTVTATGGGGSLESALSLSFNTAYTITVGAGGNGQFFPTNGSAGSNSSISGTGITTVTSTGGAGGGSDSGGLSTGGSGGGGCITGAGSAGTANQGYAGGNSVEYGGGGGGGAGAVGGNGSGTAGSALAGDGGTGVATSISGSSVTRAGGGGGVAGSNAGVSDTGAGGAGGGANGGDTGSAATANTGGGGGGGLSFTGGNGGSGIVIVRYAV